MELYSENEHYKLYQGNMLDMLDFIEPNSIDSIITDPPYELNFMNKGWDNSGIAFQKETWQKCYEVLKPGGYLLAFGGTRTFHRIACAIEDTGFEIRDTIMWLYGSGFPKSHNIGLDIDKLNGCSDRGHRIAVANRNHLDGTLEPNGDVLEPYQARTEQAKEWQGWGTALKPSYEPIIVARKPVEGTVAKNCLKYGVGGINIDECRVESNDGVMVKKGVSGFAQNYTSGEYSFTNVGRFPANTILTYDETDFDEVCGGFPNTKGDSVNRKPRKGTGVPNFVYMENQVNNIENKKGTIEFHNYCDSGSASRYFYCAKASKKDRDEGLEDFETKSTGELQGGRKEGSAGSIMQNANGGTRVNPYAGAGIPKKNTHPTVKPTELMQYLIRLVSPNGATILDPFNGSGSTGKAVMYENKEHNKNYKYIGIELTEEYLPIAKVRIEYLCNDVPKSDLTPKLETSKTAKDVQMSLFD